MRLSQEHDSNYLRLGLILVFTGFLFALIFVTRVHARELNSQIFDTEAVLVYDNDPLSVYGCDHALYFYQDSYTDEILLSSSFNPEIEQLYDHWYGSQVMDSVRSWGFSSLSYDVLKGHIINLMSRTNTFWISRYDTISNVELKEIVLDDSYVAFYFMDSNFNYYCYVSYIPVNSETVQPEFPFDSFTINSSGHFVEQDPLYRELFVWDSSNQRWVYSSVSSSDVVVHTVLKSPSGVKLGSGAQVYVSSSRFLIDDPLPSATPTPTPSSAPSSGSELEFWFKTADGEYYFVNIAYNECYGYELLNDYPPFVYVRNQYSNYNELPLIRPAIVETKQSTSTINSYFAGTSVLYVHIYDIGITYITDSNYIKSTFDYVDVTDATKYNNGYYDIECRLNSSTQGSFNLYSFYLRKSNWGQNVVYVGSNIASYSFNSSYNSLTGLNFNSGYESSCPVVYGIELMTNVREDPNLPTPTATPTPSPMPTEPPHVIVVFPTGTPTPTPPFVIPSSPPFNPPGDGITPLDPELQEDVFGVFKSKIGDNNSFGLFGLLIGLLPGDLMWYIWFLLFLLLVVGVAKLIIHFTGG